MVVFSQKGERENVGVVGKGVPDERAIFLRGGGMGWCVGDEGMILI